MRAMSLVSSDADGEQNEIRNLQEKLESTMKLVSNLSGQLTELKEQVGHRQAKNTGCVYYRALDEVHSNEVHCNRVHLHQ